MRIAQVAPLYESVPPKLYGGTERVVSYLTEALVAQGHDVTLFASADSTTSARLVPSCSSALRLRPNRSDHVIYHYLMLEEVMERAREFDIIHFHVDYLHFPFSRMAALPQLSTLHGRLDLPDLEPLFQTYSEMPVVSISKAQRKPLPHISWVGNVYHGLPENQLLPGTGRGKYLAFLGRISREKRVDRAIQMAQQTGMPLKIAAKVDLADREYFEAEIKPLMSAPGIEYIGEITENEKAAFLGDALALLFPVDWPEPFGLVMIEAMACGTPTIAFDCGSVREVITNRSSGIIVNNMRDAVKAVTEVSRISRAGCREEFERRFTAPRMAQDYVTLYEAVAESVPPLKERVGSVLA